MCYGWWYRWRVVAGRGDGNDDHLAAVDECLIWSVRVYVTLILLTYDDLMV